MILFRWLLPIIAMVGIAHGAVTVSESTQVTLLRGTATVATLSSWEACRAEALRLARASTATTGTVTYRCQTERRSLVAVYTPDPPPPPVPTVTAALTWTAVTEEVNGSAAVNVTYVVEQSPTWARIATGSTLAHTVTSAPVGTCWRVRAISSTGEGQPSNQVCKS